MKKQKNCSLQVAKVAQTPLAALFIISLELLLLEILHSDYSPISFYGMILSVILILYASFAAYHYAHNSDSEPLKKRFFVTGIAAISVYLLLIVVLLAQSLM